MTLPTVPSAERRIAKMTHCAGSAAMAANAFMDGTGKTI